MSTSNVREAVVFCASRDGAKSPVHAVHFHADSVRLSAVGSGRPVPPAAGGGAGAAAAGAAAAGVSARAAQHQRGPRALQRGHLLPASASAGRANRNSVVELGQQLFERAGLRVRTSTLTLSVSMTATMSPPRSNPRYPWSTRPESLR